MSRCPSIFLSENKHFGVDVSAMGITLWINSTQGNYSLFLGNVRSDGENFARRVDTAVRQFRSDLGISEMSLNHHQPFGWIEQYSHGINNKVRITLQPVCLADIWYIQLLFETSAGSYLNEFSHTDITNLANTLNGYYFRPQFPQVDVVQQQITSQVSA